MNNIFQKVFAWLAFGLFLSFGVAYYVSTNENLVQTIFSSNYIWFVLLELGIAFVLSLCIKKLSRVATQVLYIAYSLVTGFTLSSIFLVYKLNSIIYIFLITSFIFIALSIYGYTTKKDITKLGTILFFGLIGVIIITFINVFIIKSNNLDILLSIVSIIIFTCYIAYDVHIIKRGLYDLDEDKLAVYGAFQLYLDFINLFLDLLRIFGKSKD